MHAPFLLTALQKQRLPATAAPVPQTFPGALLFLPGLSSVWDHCPKDLVTTPSPGAVPVYLSFRRGSGMALLVLGLSSLLTTRVSLLVMSQALSGVILRVKI